MRRLNVAIIGFGIGKAHRDAFRRLPDRFHVQAVVDTDPERRAEAARQGVPETPDDIAAVLGRDDIDVVDICTPPASHVSLAERALAAGHHVILEKPLVGSLAECDRLAAAATTARGVLMPILQYRWGNGLRRLRCLIDLGITGPLHAATVETHWNRGPGYFARPWRGKFATELGGCLTNHAIHAHDLLRCIAGDAADVFARVATRINPIEVEDNAAIVFRFVSGAMATSSVTLAAVESMSRLRFVFQNLTAESGLAPHAPGRDPWRFTPRDDAIATRIAAAMESFEIAPEFFEGQFAAFHAALEAGLPPPVTLQDARAAIELLTAFYSSAATNAPVSLPLGPEHPFYEGWAPRT